MAEKTGRLNGRNLLTVLSVGILVGVEVFGLALASGWALAGLFELGEQISYVLMALFCGLGAWAMWNFMRQVLSVEQLRG